MPHLDVLCQAVWATNLDAARPALANAVRQLRQAGIQLSDRRIVKAQRLIAAAATLAGRSHATAADLWPLLYALPTLEAQNSARDVLGELFAQATHPHLLSAVEQATLQPLSRAVRLIESARACLGRPDVERAERTTMAEALLREIDANFSADTLPAELGPLRSELTALLATPA
jgi:MoxR-like ATPase